jgi:hypothetical protein
MAEGGWLDLAPSLNCSGWWSGLLRGHVSCPSANQDYRKVVNIPCWRSWGNKTHMASEHCTILLNCINVEFHRVVTSRSTLWGVRNFFAWHSCTKRAFELGDFFSFRAIAQNCWQVFQGGSVESCQSNLGQNHVDQLKWDSYLGQGLPAWIRGVTVVLVLIAQVIDIVLLQFNIFPVN